MVFIKLSCPSDLISPAHLMYCNFTLLDSTALSWCCSNPHMSCSAFSPLFSSFNSYFRFQLRSCPLDNLSRLKSSFAPSLHLSQPISHKFTAVTVRAFSCLQSHSSLCSLRAESILTWYISQTHWLSFSIFSFFKFWWERKIDLVITCGVDHSMPDHLTDQPRDSLALEPVPISGSVKGDPLLKKHLPSLEDYGCWSLLNEGWWAY